MTSPDSPDAEVPEQFRIRQAKRARLLSEGREPYPVEVARTVHPWDDYMLARALVNTEIPEDDLFAGVREFVGSTR